VARPVKHYGQWRIRWTDSQGRRHSETYAEKADAELALKRHEVEAEEIRRGLRGLTAPHHTFGEVCDYWLEHRAPAKRSAKDDRSIIRRYLRPAFGGLAVADVTVARVDGFAAGVSVGKKTIGNILTLLISLLNVAVDLGWLLSVPRIKKPRLPSTPNDYNYLRTTSDIERFLRAARDFAEALFVLYATAIFTGMRAGELAGLLWTDIDLDRRIITVQRSFKGPTKADAIRHVPILDALLPLLRRWRLQCPGLLVFPSSTGTMLQPSARVFQETLHAVLDAAGFAPVERGGKVRPCITFHGLRHTFASHWMMGGGDIYRLQRIGGWKSFSMVQRYAHLSPEAFSTDYGRLGASVPEERGGAVIAFPSAEPPTTTATERDLLQDTEPCESGSPDPEGGEAPCKKPSRPN
jgi:integrase